MLNLLNWNKPIIVNGMTFKNSFEAYEYFKEYEGEINIQLNVKTQEQIGDISEKFNEVINNKIYQITVRKYMTQPFEFHDKWNKSKPMPMRIMIGKIIEETKGMYKMQLTGYPMPSKICMKCGRTLTHPVSLHYGIGPECGKHFHINPYETEEELQKEYELLKERMQEIKWEGWIVKSAITEMKEVMLT